MVSIVNTVGGVLCGCAMSQFLEYSQQYVQRMGGALDELATVVQDFDSSAKSAGYNRDEALAVMTGSEFLESRQTDMRRTFDRFDILFDDYARLKDANALNRLAYVARMRDGEVFKGTVKGFKPAVPLNVEGAAFVSIGFLFGYGLFAGFMRLLRRKPKKVAA